MSNRYISVMLAFVGLMIWIAPGYNGFLLDSSSVSDGEAQISGAIFLVGAAIVWFQRD